MGSQKKTITRKYFVPYYPGLLHTEERRAVRRRLLHISTLCLITYQRKKGSQKKTITYKYLVPYYIPKEEGQYLVPYYIPKKDRQSEEDHYT